MYTGQWVQSKMTGPANITMPDGCAYQGECADGVSDTEIFDWAE